LDLSTFLIVLSGKNKKNGFYFSDKRSNRSIFKIFTFDFGAKFVKFSKESMFFESQISRHPIIEKFQNWVEMKVNYHTNKINTQMDFSDNFHNIKNFVQVDHFGNS
jgi:hypothetical protein